ncbi:MAG TPA: sensor histidine kinase N-terminal domain-containing protein [Steroidobacteraceae bacterium]|nr:sensor histidine kinase N-terminal domain-containing protein [Steroidobacteraceae bacterium]
MDWATASTNLSPRRVWSVRRRLLALLVLPAFVVLLAGTVSDYYTSINPVRDAYDRALADSALAIAGYVRASPGDRLTLVLPEEAIRVLSSDAIDTIYFRVSGPDRALIAGDRDLPIARAAQSNPAFDTVTYRGAPTRIVSYRSVSPAGMVTTTVGETMNKRAVVRRQLLWAVLTADFVQLVAIMALVWVGVSLALRPLIALREQISGRSARELEPLSARTVPAEVRTLVDALNRLFRRIGESSRAQQQFLESATHQLRTPLAGIQAQLELLIAEEGEPAKRDRLGLALSAARRLSHTTQQLLALARSDHAAATYADFRTVDLAAVVEASVADHVSRAVAADVDLGAELQPATVHGIAWLLAEAVNNLVDNAITYTPAGGSITVRCGTNGATVFLEVVDTGVGIPAAERARVTERFYRGHRSQGEGSGLGLAIVADVARLHGAKLSITAGAAERGTCVRLELRRPI